VTNTLPRLLLGAGTAPMALAEHLARHGEPVHCGGALVDEVDRAGLRGRGGASFPTARKLRAVASRRAVVVANGTEGEPASRKDELLLRSLPHLVIDGAVLAAGAVKARDVALCVSDHMPGAWRAVEHALADRGGRDPVQIQLVSVPSRFIAGQETALINYLNGGPLRPTFTPPRPYERGVGRRPTLVQNVETLAHLALIARHGSRWFRGLGLEDEPGSSLVTLGGAVRDPGVYEIERGMSLEQLWRDAGGLVEPVQGALVGGYFGAWVAPGSLRSVRLADSTLARDGAALGAGVLFAMPQSACVVREIARVGVYLAEHSAGQCGPCTHGLWSIADTLARLASGQAPRSAFEDLRRWVSLLPGRGACHHPDGAARFVASGLEVFAERFAEHARHGRCASCDGPEVLPTPAPEGDPTRVAA
jgi:NADH:ubiquinone oxidoreductase subunit F (NADH-binding)